MERGINVKTMADALDVDMTSIPVYDRFAPSMESMKRMADWLQVPTWELFCDCGTSSWQMFQQTVTEPLMERFARRLKELARERHLQLNVVAERAGMSKANLSLSMKRNITTSTIEKIARALEIEDKAYLLFITPSEYDAIYHAPQPVASGEIIGTLTERSSLLQAVRPMVEVEEPVLCTEAEDQLVQNDPEKDVLATVLADGTYTYGGKRIVLRGGEIVIS